MVNGVLPTEPTASTVAACIPPETYLIVVSLTALTVPATRHTFDHFLPFARTAWDAAYRGWERWVTCLPTHGLELGEERRGEDLGFQSLFIGPF